MRLSADERREQLLDVAGSLFAEHGFHGLSMERLAESAGVSKPVLYQHFPGKHDLYLALVEEAVGELEQRVREALEGAEHNRERVREAISAYFAFVGDRRAALLFGMGQLTDPDVRSQVEGVMRRLTERVGGLIAEEAGLDRARAELLAAGLRGLAVEAARWWASAHGPDRDEAVALLARLAWRGIGSLPPDRAAPLTADAGRPRGGC